jgi:hypothetical protein
MAVTVVVPQRKAKVQQIPRRSGTKSTEAKKGVKVQVTTKAAAPKATAVSTPEVKTPPVTKRSKAPQAAQTPSEAQRERRNRLSRHADIQRSSAQREAERLADVLYAVIMSRYPRQWFTRDDVLILMGTVRVTDHEAWATGTAGINDVATSTRMRKLNDAISILTTSGRLVSPDERNNVRLCLPSIRQRLADEIPIRDAYLPTVKRIVETAFEAGTIIDGMVIAERWVDDGHLSPDTKRRAIREILPLLARDGIVTRGAFNHQYIVGNRA